MEICINQAYSHCINESINLWRDSCDSVWITRDRQLTVYGLRQTPQSSDRSILVIPYWAATMRGYADFLC
ncbi:hypothetical protein BJD09_02420 [Xanthomonas citri pv. citri]|nr:hypothetical protein BJD09_02420 [Xanthomonas citri pv. citri]ARR12111.1 hypothetical protein B7L66_07465 [Xanthomonas citri pv. citri]